MVTYRDDAHLKTAMIDTIGKSKQYVRRSLLIITMLQFVTDSQTDDRRKETTE